MYLFFFFGGGVGSGGSGLGRQGGCEQRCEVFVKFKKNIYIGGGVRSGGGGGGGHRVDVNKELKFL